MSELFCNACWNGIKPGETALSTSCAHLFCQQCAGGVTASGVCTCCDGPLTPESIKEVRVLVDGDDPRDKLLLAGQSTETAVSIALAAIQFHQRQAATYEQVRLQQQQQKTARMEAQCKKKLTDVHNAYKAAKRKFEEATKQNRALQAESQELRDKYNMKATESKQLREAMARLQEDSDVLRKALDQISRQSGINLSSVPALQNHHFGGRGGGGQILPLHGPAPQRSLGSPHSMDHIGGPTTRPLTVFNPSPVASPALNLNALPFSSHTPANNASQRPSAMLTGGQLGQLSGPRLPAHALAGSGGRRDSLLMQGPPRNRHMDGMGDGGYGTLPTGRSSPSNGYTLT